MGSNARASRSRWPTSSPSCRRLDEFGIDYIEGGFPASNPKDVAFFREVAAMDLKHAQIAAFGSTCKKGVAAAEDPGLADLIACGAPVVTIVGKTWDCPGGARAANDARREPAHDRPSRWPT